MKIRSSYTDKKWLTPKPAALGAVNPEDVRDVAREQINRVLSEVVRCQNLVILTGLGTSLCVMNDDTPPKPKAPTMFALWQRVSSKYDPASDKKKWEELLTSVKHQPDNKNIEELLSACKVATVWFSGDDLTNLQSFIDLAEKEIRDAVNFLEDSDLLPIHATFLQRIARRSAGKNRAKLFTTNYDLCFERSAKDGRFVVIDGFSPTLPPTFDPVYFTYDIVKRGNEGDASAFIPNVFHLYKLHGSIDWERRASVIEKKHNTEKPLLIYPRSSKYEQAFSQPYLEMMSALQYALREPNTGLLVIGFGFNDKHIAEPILSAVRSNLGLKVVVVDPWLIDENHFDEDAVIQKDGNIANNDFLKQIQAFMDRGDARLSFLNATFEEVSQEIPDLTAETELEIHMQRMRNIHGSAS